jgi:hypothetical protein
MERLINNFESILIDMIRWHKEIVPLGLKLILVEEKAATGRTDIIKRLTAKKQTVKEIFELV